MKLVFVHGRSQQDKSSDQLRVQWTEGLRRGFAAIGVPLDPGLEIEVPYYGQLLHDHVYEREQQRLERAIARGPGDAEASDPALDAFEVGFLKELAARAGVTEDDIAAERVQIRIEQSPGEDINVERGPGNWELTHALGRLLSRRTPWLAEQVMARLTADAKAYLTRPAIADVVDDVVRPTLADDRCIVVAHSLGSIVAYRNLRRLKDAAEVPLFITVGSPLGTPVVKEKLAPPVLAIPEGVESWVNGTDERDIVALYARLDRHSFIEGIDNITDIRNREDWPHSIEDYLANNQIARRIAEAIEAG
jgi:hypothetical protein